MKEQQLYEAIKHKRAQIQGIYSSIAFNYNDPGLCSALRRDLQQAEIELGQLNQEYGQTAVAGFAQSITVNSSIKTGMRYES
jgi:hypothetical protein